MAARLLSKLSTRIELQAVDGEAFNETFFALHQQFCGHCRICSTTLREYENENYCLMLHNRFTSNGYFKRNHNSLEIAYF